MADYIFTCDKCGGQFYSKADPSGWSRHLCNHCSGKPYKDRPVPNGAQTYTPQPVPTSQVYNRPAQVQQPAPPVEEFDLEAKIADYLVVYGTLKEMIDQSTYTIPEAEICKWTTSIIIEKGRRR